jgi:hypothetical protein
MASTQIAALFPDSAAARTAQQSVVGSGVDHHRVLVMDTAHPDAAVHASAPGRLWGALKKVRVPDQEAHAYAEAISRGHALVVVEVKPNEQPAALRAMQAAGPLNVADQTETWRREGWSGTHPGQDAWLASGDTGGRQAAGSEGIVAGNLMAGDYGAVGGMIGGRPDTNILRGTEHLQGDRNAVRLDDYEDLHIYEIR